MASIAQRPTRLFGQSGSLSLTTGVVLWPVVFIMTDIINEYFGVRGVRFISWLAVGLIAYAFLFAYLAIHLAPASGGPRCTRTTASRTCRRRSPRCSARGCGPSAARSRPA